MTSLPDWERGLVVLVSGSREWPDAHDHVIVQALEDAVHASALPVSGALLVVGDCPTGVDEIAAQWWREMGGEPEVHVADWDGLGRKAGPARNQAMVDRVARLVNLGVTGTGLFFPWGRSPGTRDCLRRARSAALPALRVFEGTELMGTPPPSARAQGGRWAR